MKTQEEKQTEIEKNFKEQIEHHLEGLIDKIQLDFHETSFKAEVEDLKGDPIYSKFGLDTIEYALIRKMGRISISIGRRLGEIYDKIPRLIAQNAFNIPEDRIAPKMGGKLELDTCLLFSIISDEDKQHIFTVANKYIGKNPENGIGIEIRYNFNPNDSARLRKDVDMAGYIIGEKLLPVYLIFSSISPRDEAIARLKRAGWEFLVGKEALDFTKELYSIDMLKLLDKESIKQTISIKTKELMKSLFISHAFKAVVEKYY
jgi:hypothetical protein